MREFDPIKRGQSVPVLSSINGLVMARTPVSHAEVFQYLTSMQKGAQTPGKDLFADLLGT